MREEAGDRGSSWVYKLGHLGTRRGQERAVNNPGHPHLPCVSLHLEAMGTSETCVKRQSGCPVQRDFLHSGSDLDSPWCV